MTTTKRSVLITGCSEGGTGAALAKELHDRGLHVYATARNVYKMDSLTKLGIQTLPLDIQSEASISDCVAKIPSLDMLVNNAGAQYPSPVTDISLVEAKALFDTNVWGPILMIQAFVPLLLKSPNAMIVNHTSVGADASIPFQAVYNASKAAMSRFSHTLRMELQAFNIKVVELKTGGVDTEIVKNAQARNFALPKNSIYEPAREILDPGLRLEWVGKQGTSPERWAKEVANGLLKNHPPATIWSGRGASLSWFASFLPFVNFDGIFKRMTKLDKVEAMIKQY
ncbi:NADPH-dependent 1-acyl dihydroxyacetone phosphate reductase [Elasticomyces elasticus]|nr:NADPH-dependent 1-acyl dihydroxyacetone phosphate reductase [Elasticomyces elasticus]